jgi:hypothetical protein
MVSKISYSFFCKHFWVNKSLSMMCPPQKKKNHGITPSHKIDPRHMYPDHHHHCFQSGPENRVFLYYKEELQNEHEWSLNNGHVLMDDRPTPHIWVMTTVLVFLECCSVWCAAAQHSGAAISHSTEN